MGIKWPCPCCGHRTLSEGPGDNDVCPVCFWEDDPAALRWPLSSDGPNNMSLVEGQERFIRQGYVAGASSHKVRALRVEESREPDWRPIDLAVDDVEHEPGGDGSLPWPAATEHLYWWRSTYYRLPANRRPGPVPLSASTTPAEQLMAGILQVVPEAAGIDLALRHRFEAPAPFRFCDELATLVLEAHHHGNDELALRAVTAVARGLTSEDGDAYNCVSIAFLERAAWERPDLAGFINMWPLTMRTEIQRQLEHVAAARRQQAEATQGRSHRDRHQQQR